MRFHLHVHRRSQDAPASNHMLLILAVALPVFLAVIGGVRLLFASVLASSSDSTTSTQHDTPPATSAPQTLSPASSGYQYTGWTRVAVTAEDLSRGTLICVRAGLPFDADAVDSLVRLSDVKSSSYWIRSTNLQIAEVMVSPLNRMLDDFEAESGLKTINIVAAWRSAEEQQKLYSQALQHKGAQHAAAYLAAPGESEHHTGLAIDLALYFSETGLSDDFTGSGAYAWIADNAWRYGFIRRYPEEKAAVTGISGETWHYRYVGLPHSKIMVDMDFCLEEYLAFLKNYPFDGDHLMVSCLGLSYEIYFCTSEVFVPITDPAVISGDNESGFIITVQRPSSP